MGDLSSIGRVLVVAGLVLLAVGGLLLFAGRIPGGHYLGRLPGDLFFERGNVKVYVPIATSILASLLLTIMLSLFRR